MRIGILGGTFNPIHIGHLILAEEAVAKLGLDKLIFVPTYLPPHKDIDGIITARDRLRMVELAIVGNSKFEVSTFEIDSKKRSYSVDTLKEFRKIYGEDAVFYFLTGSDLLKDLFSWKDVSDIFKMSKFIVANRPGYPVKDVPKEVETVVITPIEISSDDIRKRIRTGRSIRYLVTDNVMKYIADRRLYSTPAS
jgi:nicotinate-nucleotide adenylyltransferase